MVGTPDRLSFFPMLVLPVFGRRDAFMAVWGDAFIARALAHAGAGPP